MTTTTLKTIELDFAYDEDDLATALFNTLNGIDVTYKIVNLAGPGGGWPVIRFTGAEEALTELLVGPYDMDDEDVAYQLEHAD